MGTRIIIEECESFPEPLLKNSTRTPITVIQKTLVSHGITKPKKLDGLLGWK